MRARFRQSLVFAVLLSLVGAATATAAVAGDPLKLGLTNTIAATTKLTGTYSGALLQVLNTSTGTAARAIIAKTASTTAGAIWAQNTGGGPAANFVVNAGKAPFTVNSGTKVPNLNADKLDGVDGSAFATRAQPGWRAVGAAGQPAFGQCVDNAEGTARWDNYPGATFNPVGFYMDTTGRVHLRGIARCALHGYYQTYGYQPGLEKIFTLPPGYRPAFREIGPSIIDGALGRIDIEPDGDVLAVLPSPGLGSQGSAYVSLDGISFRAEQ